ncbi:MAG: hypothetical protein M3R63_13505 [Actinomycetota bacterium]|nr:hypothetical protein [Actinomycetota bacterium]
MDTISPVLVDAFHLLCTDLYEHLGEAELLASKDREWRREDIDSARKLIPDLVVVIRGLLIEHQTQSSGDCRICSSKWPCPVVTTIHALVKDPDREFVALVCRANEDG